MRGPRVARAWLVFGFTVAVTVLTYVFAALNGDVKHGATASWNGFGEISTWAILMFTAAGLGVLVAARRPENPLAGVLLAGGFFGMVTVLTDQYAGYALVTRPGSVAGGVAARIISQVAFAATWFFAGVALPALFPTGRVLSKRWRFVLWIGGAGAVAWGLIVFLPRAFTDDGLLGNVPGVRNPIAVRVAVPVLDSVANFGVLLLFGGMFLAIASLVVRTVRVHGEERQQVKVVAYTVAVVTVVLLLVANVQEQLQLPHVLLDVVSDGCLFAVVASIGLALLRYRLYDVDRLINLTVVYVLVSALLGGAYAGVVFALGAVTRPLTQGSDLTVAAATLFIAALFVPVRRRVQAVIDRRFYRTRYDRRRTLEAFAARLRQETDVAALRDEIESVARQMVSPASVQLWLTNTAARITPLPREVSSERT